MYKVFDIIITLLEALVIATLIIIAGYTIILKFYSESKTANVGIIDNRLKNCAMAAPCLTSYAKINQPNYVKPIPKMYWNQLMAVIEQDPDLSIASQNSDYIWVVTASPLLKFTRDIEFYLQQNTIHIRATERVNRNDFGTLKHQVNQLRNSIQ